MKSIVYVGMDVHKATFSLCALSGEAGEILAETQCASEPRLVKQFIDHLTEECAPDTEFLTGYEAGCLGYSLYKSLQSLGIPCVIMAPSTMYSSSKNKMVKNDHMDAKMIARNLAANTYHPVYVPDEQDEDVREYLRLRKAVKKQLTRVKQQLAALFLRHGLKCESSANKWTQAYMTWARTLPVSDVLRDVIDEELLQISELEEKIARYDQTIEQFSHNERYEEPVQALTCMKGVALTTAMTLHVEISDFKRFKTAPAFMSYAGLNPSEHSSGEHSFKGGITKQGNSVVRTTLIEAAQALVKGRAGYKSKALRARQAGQDAVVISYADKASLHLLRKFERLLAQGKAYNVAITAVARALAGYVWGMETGNINY
ncbi:IS110 family transposase [Lacticaseibacillus jixianensis]|uniref:IS110 family transposase n=1 Tax=Lacticaseibacillus jixianensis TaxID=2486012 RepID=A0ABW4BB02_9LACO|nr:IS110 family transposase [Lacticaseibacillus jixianensis]